MMNEVQKKIFTLLNEIDTSCRANGLDYYLSGDTALYAFQNAELHPDAYCAYISIVAEDVSWFLKIMEAKENRAIESWKSNENYPDFSLRYIDKESLCYHIDRHKGYKHNGIYVHITIIRKRSAIKKRNFIIENGINFNSGYPQNKQGLKRFIVASGFRAAMFIYGKKRFVRKYFKNQISLGGKNTNQYKIGKKVYPRIILEGTRNELELYGQKFTTYPYLKEYFLYNYGYNWANKEFSHKTNRLMLSPHISCLDYEKELEKIGWKDKKYIKHKKRLSRLYSPKINARIRKQQLQTQYVIDTLYLKDLYLPQKEELLELHQNGQFDILDNQLQEYFDLASKKGRMMSFDRDISYMVIERIKEKRGKLYATALEFRRKNIAIDMSK